MNVVDTRCLNWKSSTRRLVLIDSKNDFDFCQRSTLFYLLIKESFSRRWIKSFSFTIMNKLKFQRERWRYSSVSFHSDLNFIEKRFSSFCWTLNSFLRVYPTMNYLTRVPLIFFYSIVILGFICRMVVGLSSKWILSPCFFFIRNDREDERLREIKRMITRLVLTLKFVSIVNWKILFWKRGKERILLSGNTRRTNLFSQIFHRSDSFRSF